MIPDAMNMQPGATPSDGEFVCASMIEFADGSNECMALHMGSRESCERVADMLPAVAYSGDRKPVRARMLIVAKAVWDRMPDAITKTPAP